jgi:hypothetical protein
MSGNRFHYVMYGTYSATNARRTLACCAIDLSGILDAKVSPCLASSSLFAQYGYAVNKYKKRSGFVRAGSELYNGIRTTSCELRVLGNVKLLPQLLVGPHN